MTRPALALGGMIMCLAIAACDRFAPAEAVTDPKKAVYAAPGGWNGGDGSRERPYDLATAIAAASPVGPGGTVWLGGGTYRGSFKSELTGTEQEPITIRPLPGEKVIIDGAKGSDAILAVNGTWTIVRDLEIMNSDPRRIAGGSPELNRLIGVDVHAVNSKIVNLVVHDAGVGLAMWADAVNTEAYGNIIYYNGWKGADRTHGHGIYTQNKDGARLLTDNIIFRQFAMGVHAYGSEEAYLDSIALEGNVIFNNGILGEIDIPGETFQTNILLGGGRLAKNPVLKSNYTYYRPAKGGASNVIGSGVGCENLVMQDNYFVGIATGYAIELVNCAGVVKGNVLSGLVRGISGQHIVTQPELRTLYPDNTFPTARLTGVNTFVRPNRHDPHRAHVVVYNWDGAETAQVDLASMGIKTGAGFEIRDVQNLGAEPIVSGAYTGRPVSVPMNNLTVAPVIGWNAAGWKSTPLHTAPDFAVFLVTVSPDEPSVASSFVAKMRGLIGW